MQKETYERTDLEIIKFQTQDVITTSGEEDQNLDEYEIIVNGGN